MIPALKPVLRPVFGVDEVCGETVIISGEVLDQEFVEGLKEGDAGDVIVNISVNGLKEVDAGDSIVEARDGFVEEGTDKSDSTTADEETVNCSGEGAWKV